MAYGLTATSKIASEKQINFILSLEQERSHDKVQGDTIETIMNALQGNTVTSSEASAAIGDLLAQPKVIKGEAAASVKPAADRNLLGPIPISKYAVEIAGEGLVFLEVKEYKDTRYLRQLIGAPGDWKKIKPVGARRVQLASAIMEMTPAVAAHRYSVEFTCCAACGSPLSDELSRARGIGPVCWQRFV